MSEEKNTYNTKFNLVQYLFLFTCLFTIISLIVFSQFIINKKSFIWISDGTDQHFTALMYYSSYLKKLLHELVYTGKLAFPMWDFKIGQGSDILTTLNYYCIGDPLTLLVIFFPKNYMEFCYNALIILRIYLGGLAFSTYCFYLNKSRMATMLGAFVYMFCGYTLIGLKHPFFLNPLIYLPLLFLGIEKILRKEKANLFIVMVFISAISNFYFLFMLSLLIVIYTGTRYFSMSNVERKTKGFIQAMTKGILSYILGIGLSSFILLPVLYMLKTTSRYSGSSAKLFRLYSTKYYFGVFSSFTSVSNENYWTTLGFAATVVVVIASLFAINDPKLKHLRAAFIIGVCFIIFPEVGYFFNGFAYVSNRWIFAFSFVIALSFTTIFPYLQKRVSNIIWIGCGLWILFYFIADLWVSSSKHHVSYAGIIVLVIVILVMFVINKYGDASENKTFMYAFFWITLISICINANMLYSDRFGGKIKQYSYKNIYLKKLSKSSLNVLKTIKDSSFYRVDTYKYTISEKGEKQEISSNESMLLGYRGLSTYFSLINPNYTAYIDKLDVIGDMNLYRIYGLDNRTTLNELASVKYFITLKKNNINVPYGYKFLKDISAKDNSIALYQNQYALPLGFTYDKYINMSGYEKLGVVDKQQIMLDNVVLDDNVKVNGQVKGIYTSEIKEIPYTESVASKAEVKNKKAYDIHKYSIKPMVNSEVYVLLKNVHFKGAKAFNVIAQARESLKFAKFYNKRDIYYYGRKDAVINLGYYNKGISNFMLYIDQKGVLKYSSLKVIGVPMNDYKNKVGKLRADSLNSVTMSTNAITGSINVKANKILCMTIPYSDGWKAKVDGNNVPIYKANLMYMAIPLKAGNHKIELRYSTPGLKTGVVVSIFALLIYLGIFIVSKRNLSRQNKL